MRRRPFHAECAYCRKPRAKWRRFCTMHNAAYCSMKCVYQAQAIRGRCHVAIFGLVASGQLPRAQSLKCADCGAKATCYDHRDYAKPLDVEAVCHSCNIIRGPGSYARLRPDVFGRGA